MTVRFLRSAMPRSVRRVLRCDEHVVLLPINTLDQIKPLGGTAPAPQGTITGRSWAPSRIGPMGASSSHQPRRARWYRTTPCSSPAPHRTTASIRSPRSTAADSRSRRRLRSQPWAPGKSRSKEDDNLIFDGMVTAYKVLSNGKLMVAAVNHGLEVGDHVQIVGSTS